MKYRYHTVAMYYRSWMEAKNELIREFLNFTEVCTDWYKLMAIVSLSGLFMTSESSLKEG